MPSKKLDKCPICGSYGEDMVFKFYCPNSNCQNYIKTDNNYDFVEPGCDGDEPSYYISRIPFLDDLDFSV